MDAVDCIGLAGSSTTLGAVRAGFKVKFRLALPGGFGNASVEGNRRVLGDFPIQTSDPSLWEPQKGVCYLCGVPPCSGFSQLNTAAAMSAKHGSSAANFRGAASPINECQRALVEYAARCSGGDGKAGPEVVVFESVPGAYHQGLALMREYHQILKARTGQPYVLHHLLHSDASLGGAQARPRYFWAAARVPFGVAFDEPGHPPSYEEVFGDLAGLPMAAAAQDRGPRPPSGWARRLADTPQVSWHLAHTRENIEQSLAGLMPLWPPGASVSVPLVRYMDANGGALPPGVAQGWWKNGKLNMFESNIRRVAADRRGCWVIPGGCEAKFAHYAEARFLTVREFARLMSLPDSWSFDYTRRVHDAVNMTAKACPVTSAEWVALAARAALEGRPQESDPALWARLGEDELVMDVTDRWKAALPEGYDPAAHTQGAYGGRRTAPPARPAKTPSEPPRAPQEAVSETREVPRALPRWGGGPVKDFWRFVHERQAIWRWRSLGQPRPWTQDRVMAARFFTNCFRELDPGTALARRIAEAGADRPAWEQLWNLVLYRRFNREETWRALTDDEYYIRIAELTDSDEALARTINLLEDRAKARRAAKEAVFTDAHQVFPLNDVEGEDLIARIFNCAYEAADTFPLLAEGLLGSGSMREAFKLMKDEAGAGIASFLGWQLTLDCTLGPRPLVAHSPDEWAPVTTGARVGLIMHMNWPRLGLVSVSGWTGGQAAVRAGAWPALDPVPPAALEAALTRMRDAQDEEFRKRGLSFELVASPDHPRLTMAALEHSLCEWQKYVSVSTGMPSSTRVYDREQEAEPAEKRPRGAARSARRPVKAEVAGSSPAEAATSKSGEMVPRAAAQEIFDSLRDSVLLRPEWALLSGPTALARILIAEGKGDNEVLAATKGTFGRRTEGPHLFTRTDLARLRARLLKRA